MAQTHQGVPRRERTVVADQTRAAGAACVPAFRAKATLIAPDRALVSVSGELDLYTSDAFADALREAAATRAAVVIVDLSATTFVDSTAVGVLVHRAKRLEPQRRIVIVAGESTTLRVFEVTGLSRLYDVHTTLSHALAAVEPQEAA
jgi:anti-sigma B factor antagonist